MRKWLTAETFAVLAGFCILLYILIGKPFVGVADNGDFMRIMSSIGLNYYDAAESYEDRFFGFAHQYFAYDAFFRGFYPSSQLLVVAVARLIGAVFHPAAFDIRVLGLLYGLLLLAATWVIVRSGKFGSRLLAVILALCLLVVFYDIGYLAYFNSLFGEPISLVSMLLSIGLGLWLAQQKQPSRKLLWLFFIAAFVLTTSKLQNAPVGIAYALIGLRFMKLRDDFSWRRLTLWLSASLCVISIVLYVTAPKELKHINLYQTVFFGVLNGSPDVKGDLKELGLPERLEVLAGTNYFQAGTAIKQDDPSLKDDFYSRVSHGDVLLFYLKHPARFVSKMEFAAENGMSIRPYYLGNYLKSENKPPRALDFTYSTWSEFKNKHVPHTLWFIVLVYVLYYGVALFEYFRYYDTASRIRNELLMLVGLVGLFSFLVPILGDGQADMAKHQFMFNVCFDMMLVTAVAWIVYQLVNLRVWGRRKAGAGLYFRDTRL
ncbi:hypothetical protein [Paenibacillus physcomitrellae]|uniref:Membrane protein n=1 Tax=Paenibacillus physcomitrellae TaxID=1619311 RepID=A0ABQ1FKC5_9BACL|nr:hypothetical protein [Paenibacillus physcomitrellae]GGA19885.1 membrane protein [Paenibacillus physcomitrellae]